MIERSSITLPYPPPGAADPRSYHPRDQVNGGHPPFGTAEICRRPERFCYFCDPHFQVALLGLQKLLFRLGKTLIFTKRYVDPTSHRLSHPIWALPRAFIPHFVSSRCKANTLISCETSANCALPAPQQPPRRPAPIALSTLQARLATLAPLPCV